MTITTQKPEPFSAESAAEAFTDAVLEAIVTATWPDGSILVDIDKEILRQRLAPQIHDAALAMLTVPVPTGEGIPTCENCGRTAPLSLSFPGSTFILCSFCVLTEHQGQTTLLASSTGRTR